MFIALPLCFVGFLALIGFIVGIMAALIEMRRWWKLIPIISFCILAWAFTTSEWWGVGIVIGLPYVLYGLYTLDKWYEEAAEDDSEEEFEYVD